MNTLRKVCESDENGTLHVDVPVGAPHKKVEVVVSWEDSTTKQAWPAGWFEATFGSIDDPTFMRHSQGTYEVREALE